NVGTHRDTKLSVGDSSQRSVTATFNRETRTCHICKTVSVENCADMKVSGRRIRKKDCNTSVNEECEDIQM
ncbi:MAG: hypothetical protein IJQ55_00510, partial [Alphaproteobacteria bacterium]|nr:hypothetical protein [Alphaproteobacteria bacterium]